MAYNKIRTRHIRDIFDESMEKARTDLSKDQKTDLYKKIKNRLDFEVEEDGGLMFLLK